MTLKRNIQRLEAEVLQLKGLIPKLHSVIKSTKDNNRKAEAERLVRKVTKSVSYTEKRLRIYKKQLADAEQK